MVDRRATTRMAPFTVPSRIGAPPLPSRPSGCEAGMAPSMTEGEFAREAAVHAAGFQIRLRIRWNGQQYGAVGGFRLRTKQIRGCFSST